MEYFASLPLLAMGVHAFLDGPCFILAVVCGYWLCKKQDDLIVSILIGGVIGVLFTLDGVYRGHYLEGPEIFRPAIGAVGGLLGWLLARSRQKKTKQEDDEV